MSWYKDSQSRNVDGANAQKWFYPIKLGDWREVSSNDIPDASGNGGVLATDSTPAYQYVNGDTDSAHELRWASSNSDPITVNVPLPPWLAPGTNILLKVWAKMAGSTDTPVLDLDTFFDLGDTKVEDASSAVTGTTMAVYTITIAAADIPTTFPKTMSLELTPAAHTTDALIVMATWLEGTLLP